MHAYIHPYMHAHVPTGINTVRQLHYVATFSFACIAMHHLNKYIQTNKDASIDENTNADYKNMHKYIRQNFD